jgi:hypothetical protein
MKASVLAIIASLSFIAAPIAAQDADEGDGLGEIIVTGSVRRTNGVAVAIVPPPVIGLRRQADSAVRNIEIVSDSRDEDMRKREVQAMLLAAIDRAKREGFSLVTGQYEVIEVTRDNWQEKFPNLARKADADEEEEEEDDDDDDDDEDKAPPPSYEDDGSETIVRLKVKTKLDGSIDDAQRKIGRFVKSVPATGRSEIRQKGVMALTIINPEQYRDEIYRRIAAGAKHALTFYGPEYGLDINGLDKAIAWKQVSNTQVFLYIPYDFGIEK